MLRLALAGVVEGNTRYATFGFNDVANFDDNAMWPTAFRRRLVTVTS